MEKLFVEIIILIVATFEIILGLYLYIQIREAKDWVKTESLIIDSHLHTMQFNNKFNKSYRPRITYRYIWNGKEYTSKKVYFGDYIRIDWSAPSKKILANYKVGEQAIAYCNPQKPEESVLIRDNYSVVWLQLVVGFIFLGIYLFIKFYPL